MLGQEQLLALKALVDEHGAATITSAVRYIDAATREIRRAEAARQLGLDTPGPRAGSAPVTDSQD